MAQPAGSTHPFSVRDMLAMDRITDPQVSPDGKFVVFAVRQTDLDANCGRTHLWIVSTDGTGLRRLTSHPESDSNPRWGPDSRTIWFVSGRSGSSQVWKIAVDGGEAEQVTKEPLDVGNLLVCPDGKYIAYTMEVFPDGKTVQDTKSRLDEREKSKATGRVYESLFVRHWDTWEDGRRSHLFVRPVAGGDAVDVMQGMDADTPSQPFGGPEEIAFTPDGKGIVFAARNVGRGEAWSTNFDLYYAPVDGSAAPRCLTEENKAWDTLSGLLARRQDAGLSGDEPAGLRVRSVPDRPAGLAQWPDTRPGADLGSQCLGDRLVRRRQEPLRHRRRYGAGVPVLPRCQERHQSGRWSRRGPSTPSARPATELSTA